MGYAKHYLKWNRKTMTRRKIAIFTGNRAEYGLQYPIVRAIAADPRLEYFLLVGGAHLQQDFGRTMAEIKADGFHVYREVEIQMGDQSCIAERKVTRRTSQSELRWYEQGVYINLMWRKTREWEPSDFKLTYGNFRPSPSGDKYLTSYTTDDETDILLAKRVFHHIFPDNAKDR